MWPSVVLAMGHLAGVVISRMFDLRKLPSIGAGRAAKHPRHFCCRAQRPLPVQLVMKACKRHAKKRADGIR